ncbi:MAG TPA: hypothetical protein G4O07_00995 [Dehalococcoidia bacterium]|nr:hypothetical protein [Dehalococcoidia bacterium]
MASIVFAGTYYPITCGIADYTQFLTSTSPPGRWRVLSFDLHGYGMPLAHTEAEVENVWYGIPGKKKYSSTVMRNGLNYLIPEVSDAVLWFQHEFGIFRDDRRFVEMLRDLDIPKIVTFHSLHFEAGRKFSGLKRQEHKLLSRLLPCVDAITVFSRGVLSAVNSAFPEYTGKVHVLRHGIHHYPQVIHMSRKQAREALNDFLVYESDLDPEVKDRLYRERTLQDPSIFLVGQTGFLCPSKGSERLWSFRDDLQQVVTNRHIVAMRIGSARLSDQIKYARKLRNLQNGIDKILIETWLPREMLPIAQRAFDVNYYWPLDCTQSGVLAHALGAGAIVAGRELEGVGEALQEAGQIYDKNPDYLLLKTASLLRNPELAARMEEEALRYASRFSWPNQVRKHYHLAQEIISPASHSYTRRDALPLDKPTPV